MVPPTPRDHQQTPIETKKLAMRRLDPVRHHVADVRVPADAILPRCGGLRGAPIRCLNEARYGIIWGALGSGPAI